MHHVTPADPPTLIVHGDADQLVPYASGKSMYDALRAQGVTAELLTLEGAPHGFTGGYADRALAAALNWFKTHLGGKR